MADITFLPAVHMSGYIRANGPIWTVVCNEAGQLFAFGPIEEGGN